MRWIKSTAGILPFHTTWVLFECFCLSLLPTQPFIFRHHFGNRLRKVVHMSFSLVLYSCFSWGSQDIPRPDGNPPSMFWVRPEVSSQLDMKISRGRHPNNTPKPLPLPLKQGDSSYLICSTCRLRWTQPPSAEETVPKLIWSIHKAQNHSWGLGHWLTGKLRAQHNSPSQSTC